MSNLPKVGGKVFFPTWTLFYFLVMLSLKELLCLNIYKAPGPDAIYPFLLRTFAHHICVPLSLVFSKFLIEGYVPEDWRCANITPSFKKGIGRSPVITGLSVSQVLFVRSWNLLLKSQW